MITKIKNADDAYSALNENFEKLVTGKRKIIEAKEVNNTIGKMISIAKTQVMDLIRRSDAKSEIPWLLPANTAAGDAKELKNTN